MSERSGERRLTPRARKQRILSALAKLGGDATIQQIAAESGINTNGISQTLASESMAVFAERYSVTDPETGKITETRGKLSALALASFNLNPDGTPRTPKPEPTTPSAGDELPPPKHGPDVLF